MRTFAMLLLGLLAASPAIGREYAPRVVSPHRADAYSMTTFRQFPRWRDLEGDRLAWEVYRYLADTRSGLFHMNEVLEGCGELVEYRTVRDPVKIVNVYGYGYCGILGPVMAGVWHDMGLGRSRTVVLPGWNHVLAEVYYGDGWHYLDLDVRAAFRRGDGTLASLADARSDPSLWQGRGPLFFPKDQLDVVEKIYRETPVHHYHGFHQSGHTMDFVIRQGEILTRWWTPQGGRWSHPEKYNRVDWLVKLLEEEPRGPKPNHREFTVHNHANGRFVYGPDLRRGSTDFEDGVYDFQNVQPGGNGFTLVEPGDGYAIFEVRTPYVIVPLVGKMETTDDDREASVVEIDAPGSSLSLSTDGGLTWTEMEVAGWPATVDLTRHVSGTYGYLLKVTLRGQPGEAVVRSLRMTTWVQVAPAALPCLGPGTNRMEYRTGDHYGLDTRVVEVRSDAGQPGDFPKYLVAPPEDFDHTRVTGRIVGTVVVRVEAPPGAKIAWFSAGASFQTHLHEDATKNRNSIAYAVDDPQEFEEIYRADVPTDTEHWHYNAHREVRLERPAEWLFVRYHGDPALNHFRIYAHCVDDGRPSDEPVRITHVWSEAGGVRTKTVSLDGPGEYAIQCHGEPADQSIEIAVPSHAGHAQDSPALGE